MMSKKDGPPREAAAPRRVDRAAPPKGERRLLLVHDGAGCRLQVTKNGKLLLTK